MNTSAATLAAASKLARPGLPWIQRAFFSKPPRPFNERMRHHLDEHKNRRLVMSRRNDNRPNQFQVPQLPARPTVVTKERKLPSMAESRLPYKEYSPEAMDKLQNFETYYDPLFNPNLYEDHHRVNPDEEPFNAIYADSQAESANDYTKVRDITSPELWACVERLGRLKVAPLPKLRKTGEPVVPLPSGYVPPSDSPPDLPYFISRTRNHLLPVYYMVNSDPNECQTVIKLVTGDLWRLEADLRTHLESLQAKKRRILSSVQEPDEVISFRGKYIHEVVDWLHAQGF